MLYGTPPVVSMVPPTVTIGAAYPTLNGKLFSPGSRPGTSASTVSPFWPTYATTLAAVAR